MEQFRKLLFFILLLLTQVLVLNRIHLFHCATPMLYVYIMLLFRRNYPRWGILVWGFTIGLCIDIFSNTPGVAAASLTLLGLLQPYILMLFVQRDSPDDLQPSMNTLGVANFTYYTIIVVLLYCTVFLTFETFNFFNWIQWLEGVGGSTAITVAIILVIENLRKG
ncbi:MULTISPECIES: rod shape-determining protein MreD [Prevotellaceae]|uniref:rod shape-determining protein MreD n=1 Tax=Prevotellaceae TaxID=171552 RepID=UPI0003D35227|nr:rod shape-determining protein MreD [Prevotella phocaeensis]ETD16526.1 rod shape-determining protein MreD [Hoylesella oralis CC98A]